MRFARLLPTAVALAIATRVASHASLARAEDPKKDDITVVPLNAALLKVSSADNKFAPSFITPFLGPGIQLALSASVPLDEKTRTAPFLAGNKLLPGFRSTLALTWSSAYMELKDGPPTQRTGQVLRGTQHQSVPGERGQQATISFLDVFSSRNMGLRS